MRQPESTRIFYVLWTALFVSTVLFLLVAQFVSPGTDTEPDPVLLPALAFMSVSVGAVSILLPPYLRRYAFSKLEIATREIEDPQSFPGSGKTLKVPVDPSAALKAVDQAARAPFILGCALAESIAVFGLALGQLGFGMAFTFPFFVACWLLMLLHFPRPQKRIHLAETVTGISLSA